MLAIALRGLAMRWRVRPCREWRGARVARVEDERNRSLRKGGADARGVSAEVYVNNRGADQT